MYVHRRRVAGRGESIDRRKYSGCGESKENVGKNLGADNAEANSTNEHGKKEYRKKKHK